MNGLQINNNLSALNGHPAWTGESLKAPEERLLQKDEVEYLMGLNVLRGNVDN